VRCNLCGWSGRAFFDRGDAYGGLYRNSTCPSCHSQPRHRSFRIILEKILPQGRTIKFLHFAPEPCISGYLKSKGNLDYLTVDIDPRNAMKREDITDLSFQDCSFDFIMCSHVLEHVEDDLKAINELYRVLKPGGASVINVPIDYTREKTFHDSAIKSPHERTKAYWQWDHLRLYGRDFPEKLKAAGFYEGADSIHVDLRPEDITYFGLLDTPIHICRKT